MPHCKGILGNAERNDRFAMRGRWMVQRAPYGSMHCSREVFPLPTCRKYDQSSPNSQQFISIIRILQEWGLLLPQRALISSHWKQKCSQIPHVPELLRIISPVDFFFNLLALKESHTDHTCTFKFVFVYHESPPESVALLTES